MGSNIMGISIRALKRRRNERGPLTRVHIMRAYTTGALSRGTAMCRLGFTWYGQLTDAMASAGLRIELPASVRQRMDRSIDAVFAHEDA